MSANGCLSALCPATLWRPVMGVRHLSHQKSASIVSSSAAIALKRTSSVKMHGWMVGWLVGWMHPVNWLASSPNCSRWDRLQLGKMDWWKMQILLLYYWARMKILKLTPGYLGGCFFFFFAFIWVLNWKVVVIKLPIGQHLWVSVLCFHQRTHWASHTWMRLALLTLLDIRRANNPGIFPLLGVCE